MKFSSSHILKHKKQQVKLITYLTEHTEDVIPSACNQYKVTETGTPSVWYEFCHPLGTGLPPASQLGQGTARVSPEAHQQLTARGWVGWGGARLLSSSLLSSSSAKNVRNGKDTDVRLHAASLQRPGPERLARNTALPAPRSEELLR